MNECPTPILFAQQLTHIELVGMADLRDDWDRSVALRVLGSIETGWC